MPNHSLSGIVSIARSERGLSYVDYIEDGRSISFWCRRGGGKVWAYVYGPVAVQRQQQHAWALDRKIEMTASVVEHYCAKLPVCRIEFATEGILALKGADG